MDNKEKEQKKYEELRDEFFALAKKLKTEFEDLNHIFDIRNEKTHK